MDNTFFTFIKPYLSFIDNGKLYRKPFSWLYVVLAVANLLFPFYVLYSVIDLGIFNMGAKFIIAFIFVWLVLLFAAWISFQLWWDRKDKVLETVEENAEFPATPVISHFIQTLGEWFGTWFAIVGAGFALFATIFLGSEAGYLASGLHLPIGHGIVFIVIAPIYGFLIIVFSRLTAELIKATVAIANNTNK
jgi:hypothetical protein